MLSKIPLNYEPSSFTWRKCGFVLVACMDVACEQVLPFGGVARSHARAARKRRRKCKERGGIRNRTNDWNSESKFYWQILESSRISIFNNDFKVPSTRFEIFIAYSKISTLDSGFKKLRIHRKCVDGSRIPKEKVANSIRSLNVTLNAWMRTAIFNFVTFFSCLSVNDYTLHS